MITDKQIQQLTTLSDEMRLSILLPTHRSGHEVIQGHDMLNLKTNLKEARQRLRMEGWEDDRIRQFLRPARELLDDDSFWPYQSDGLAIYLSESVQQIHRLPIRFENMVYLANEFYLKPLSPMIGEDARFFILSLSQHQAAFHEASAHSITSVKINDLMPLGVDEMQAMPEEKVLQMHSVGDGSAGQYHGHGAKKDYQDIALEKYLRRVDKGLMKMLHDESPPLVFAGVDELFAAYKQVNSYPHMIDSSISGNPFSMGATSLHEHAWNKVKFHFDRERESHFQSFHELSQEGKTSSSIDAILRASLAGKVECLFTRDDRNLWGTTDPLHKHVQIHPMRTQESRCLLNKATIQTLNQGGKLYNVPAAQMPVNSQAPVAAIFRY